jgi:alkylation response protein AidB-like acyl-CoA dehydrogenase
VTASRADDDALRLLTSVAAEFARPDAERVRRVRDAGGCLDRHIWRQLADIGWLATVVPQEQGGVGLGIQAAAIIARRLGYAGFPEPFVAAGVLAPSLLAASSASKGHELMTKVIAGELVSAVAWQGSRGGLGMEAIDVTVREQAGRYLLSGESRFIGVGGADAYLVAARDGEGVSVYLLPAGTPGLVVGEERMADGMASAVLSLTDVGATEGRRIIERERGQAALTKAVDAARVAVAAELLGIMDRVLEMTLEYLRQRKQFGRPIGSLQALQHRVVDVWIQRELCTAALEAALCVHDSPQSTSGELAVAASSVKARASQAAPQICKEALQLHGAIGFTDEYDLGLYINRALSISPWLGTAAEHRHRYAGLVDIATYR